MIDIKFLRENPDVVKENIKKKFQDHKLHLVDEVIELDKKRRENQAEADDIRAEKNKISRHRARRKRRKQLRQRLPRIPRGLQSLRHYSLSLMRRFAKSCLPSLI